MFTKTDYKMFEVAQAISRISDMGRIKIGSCIVLKKDVLAVNANMKKTHPIQMQYNTLRSKKIVRHYMHAEMGALVKIKDFNILRGAKIYVYRDRRDNNIGICRPCVACMAAIAKCGITDVYYTTNVGYAYEKIDVNQFDEVNYHLPHPCK